MSGNKLAWFALGFAATLIFGWAVVWLALRIYRQVACAGPRAECEGLAVGTIAFVCFGGMLAAIIIAVMIRAARGADRAGERQSAGRPSEPVDPPPG